MNPFVIETSGLGKKFGNVTALTDINLSVSKGEIFSIVGPDGAGKTTLIRILCGILVPSSGLIKILSYDFNTQRKEIKNNIGYLSQRFSLYGDLTVDENIDFFAGIHREKNYNQRKEELLDFTRLIPFRNRLAEHLSGGMKQKLALACTLIHKPQLILLDEPTTGVDPVSRRDFWKILSALLKTGITIFMATPYLDEAERCTRVALMNEGRILLCEVPNKIRNSLKSKIIEIVCDDPRNASKYLLDNKNISNVQMFGDRLHISVAEGVGDVDMVNNILKEKRINLISVREIMPSIEDVFISITSQ